MDKALDFSKAANSYRDNAIVQKQMAKSLCLLCEKYFGKKYSKIFEIGCGTGLLSENIVKNFIFDELILNDITDNFTGLNYPFLKGDVTKIDLAKNCNLIISNACFQWILDIEKFLLKIKNSLANDGVLAFSSFGKDNCIQFKSIENTGLFYADYLKILPQCGYEIVEYEMEIQTIYFSSPIEVLRHIKSTGAMVNDNHKWNKERLKTFEAKYRELFGDENGVALTYNPVYVLAKVK